MIYLEELTHVLCPTLSFVHSLYLCSINDLLQNWVSLATCFVSLFNVFILWMLMIIIVTSIIYFNIIHSTVIWHAIQLYNFVYDTYTHTHTHIYIYICPYSCTYWVFLLLTYHNLAFMLFVLPNLPITKP